MLDFYFKYPRVLRRLRDGALGNEMDRIAAHFFDLGYDPASAKIYIGRLAKFSEFAARGAGTARIDQDVIDRFLLSLRTESPRISARTAIVHARRVAPERFSAPCRQAPRDPDGPLLAAYQDHLLRVRGLEPKTCEGHLTYGRRILVWLRDNLPDQPLAKMTGEHVLALVQHFLSLTANDSTRSAATSYLITRLRQLDFGLRTNTEHHDLQGHSRWRAIRFNSRKASARPNSMNYMGPRNGVTRSWRGCAGLMASNVPTVAATAIAWSSAARASSSNATPAASRPR